MTLAEFYVMLLLLVVVAISSTYLYIILMHILSLFVTLHMAS